MPAPATVLFAPDSFKGSLSSVEVARALAIGWARARPNDTILLSPLGDGGQGTIEAIAAAGGWTWRTAQVRDPLLRPIQARWLVSEDGTRAIIEMAEASGLSLLRPDERDAWAATSVGTGELMGIAIDEGVRHITLAIGGSATTDGGRGLLEGLTNAGSADAGADADQTDQTDQTDRTDRTDQTRPLGTPRRLDSTDVEVACDVSNPLLGPDGAAAIYGPQKGASPQLVQELDERNAAWADELEAREGRVERHTPGAGAAGGVGFALLAIQARFRSFALRPGVDLVMEATDFDAKLARADLVITGEGRIDAQTGFGKTALGVAQRAHAAGVPCIAVGGGVEPEGIDALATVGAVAVPVTERPQSVEDAMAAGPAPLERCGERMAHVVGLLTKSRD